MIHIILNSLVDGYLPRMTGDKHLIQLGLAFGCKRHAVFKGGMGAFKVGDLSSFLDIWQVLDTYFSRLIFYFE